MNIKALHLSRLDNGRRLAAELERQIPDGRDGSLMPKSRVETCYLNKLNIRENQLTVPQVGWIITCRSRWMPPRFMLVEDIELLPAGDCYRLTLRDLGM